VGGADGRLFELRWGLYGPDGAQLPSEAPAATLLHEAAAPVVTLAGEAGGALALGCMSGELCFRAAPSAAEPAPAFARLAHRHAKRVTCVRFSRDSPARAASPHRFLASAGADGLLLVFELGEGEPRLLHKIPAGGTPTCVLFASPCELAFYAGGAAHLSFLALPSAALTAATLNGERAYDTHASFEVLALDRVGEGVLLCCTDKSRSIVLAEGEGGWAQVGDLYGAENDSYR
jgi:hypothetical protein